MDNSQLRFSVRAAIIAHEAWKEKLDRVIATGEMPDKAMDAGNDDRCSFGHWLHSDQIDEATKQGKPYQVINRLHSEFHKCTADILQLAEYGRLEEAQNMMAQEYAAASAKLMRALKKWDHELKAAVAA